MEDEGVATEKPTSPDEAHPQSDEIAELWRDFLSNSTLHGLHIALGANTRPCRRFVWCFSILACTCFMLFQLVRSCETFLEYRVVYETRDEYQESLPFPAVSICNNNMMRRSRINGTDAQWYLDNFDPSKNRSHHMWNSSFDVEGAVRLYGHNMSDMLYDCSWEKTTKCTARDFVTFLDFRVRMELLVIVGIYPVVNHLMSYSLYGTWYGLLGAGRLLPVRGGPAVLLGEGGGSLSGNW